MLPITPMATLLEFALYLDILAACLVCFAVTGWLAKQHRSERPFTQSIEGHVLSEEEYEQFRSQRRQGGGGRER